jgi:transcriptional regulator, propionate catabolism operon regulatory protein
MMEQVFKVGFIYSTRQVIDCALSAAAKLNINISTTLAGLDACIPAGLRMEQEGVEVIISPRGTASVLRKNLKIPILSVRISLPDIFLNIRDASLMGRKILLTSFGEQKIEGVELLQEFFNVTVIPGFFHDTGSLEKAIIQGKEQGCEIVMGGGVSMSLAKKHGLRGVELQPNEGAIISTIEDALSAAGANREEQEKTLRYRTIMDTTSEGIIALDKNGIITAINHAARQFLGLPELMVSKPFTDLDLGGHVREVLDSGRPLLNKIERLEGAIRNKMMIAS